MKSFILVAAITFAGLLFATNAKAQNAAAAKEPAIDKEKVDALQPKPTDKTGIANSKPPSSTPVKKDAETNQSATAAKETEPVPVARKAEKQNLPEKAGKAKTTTLELPQPYKTVE